MQHARQFHVMTYWRRPVHFAGTSVRSKRLADDLVGHGSRKGPAGRLSATAAFRRSPGQGNILDPVFDAMRQNGLARGRGGAADFHTTARNSSGTTGAAMDRG